MVRGGNALGRRGYLIFGAAARPVWAGMTDASRATRAKVRYLPSVGATAVDDVRPYLAGLVGAWVRAEVGP